MLGSPEATTLILALLGMVSSSFTIMTIATIHSYDYVPDTMLTPSPTLLIPYEVVIIVPIVQMGKPRLEQPA